MISTVKIPRRDMSILLRIKGSDLRVVDGPHRTAEIGSRYTMHWRLSSGIVVARFVNETLVEFDANGLRVDDAETVIDGGFVSVALVPVD
jgi:hypothetical protein